MHPTGLRRPSRQPLRPCLWEQIFAVRPPGVQLRKDFDQVLVGIQVNESTALADGEHCCGPIAAAV